MEGRGGGKTDNGTRTTIKKRISPNSEKYLNEMGTPDLKHQINNLN